MGFVKQQQCSVKCTGTSFTSGNSFVASKTKILMTLRVTFLIACLFASLFAFAQWDAVNPLPASGRARSTAFMIDNKVYVVGGYGASGNALSDMWEYDINTGIWTQQPDFPGEPRFSAVSFVLDGKGYIATGASDFGFMDDLWEFNPANGSWTERTGLPANSPQRENQRREAFAFVVNGKAYLGGGEGFVFGPNSTTNFGFYDLWEYNSMSNTWIQKTGLPDFIGRNMSVAGVINGKAYVGLGCNADQDVNHQSFWQYDPVTDTWTPKAPFPTNFTTDATAFVYDSNFYVMGGVNLNPVSFTSQCRKYDPATDTWTAAAPFNGGAVGGGVAVSNDTVVFAGTGFNSSLVPGAGWWRFPHVPVTAVNDPGMESTLQIYPNPATDLIQVSTAGAITGLEVYDLAGRLVLRQHEPGNTISIGMLSPGAYRLHVVLADGHSRSARFIRQ